MSGSEECFTPRADLITFEVLRHRLWQINDEQGRSIINVSGSPVASEVNDFNVGLADAQGNLICLGPYNLFHVSSNGLMIRNALKVLGEKHIGEGDVYICNDPWMGAVHHSDVCFIAPVHHRGELVAWASSTIHQVDIGGTARELEPARAGYISGSPALSLPQSRPNGEVQPEVVETYLTNSRTPHLLELDLRAQIAAANVAKERLGLLFSKYGVKTVRTVMADMLYYTEYLLRRKLRTYRTENGMPKTTLTTADIRKRSTRSGSRYQKRHVVDVRLHETDRQSDGPINSTFGGLLGGLFAALATFLCNDIPWNDGALRPIRIVSEPRDDQRRRPSRALRHGNDQQLPSHGKRLQLRHCEDAFVQRDLAKKYDGGLGRLRVRLQRVWKEPIWRALRNDDGQLSYGRRRSALFRRRS